MQVYFTLNMGRKFRDSSWCPLDRGSGVLLMWGLLNTGFTVWDASPLPATMHYFQLIQDGGQS